MFSHVFTLLHDQPQTSWTVLPGGLDTELIGPLVYSHVHCGLQTAALSLNLAHKAFCQSDFLFINFVVIPVLFPVKKQQRSDEEQQTGHGEQRASPARLPFGKKQLPPIPKNATPITKPASMGTPAQSANGTHASYGPFYLEYSLLAEL